MSNIVQKVKTILGGQTRATGLTTGQVRSISANLYRELDNRNIGYVLECCGELLEERTWALSIIAYDWAFRVRDQYNEETFFLFESWLKRYVRDWYDCDDFCTHALGALVSQNNTLFPHIIKWTRHPDFWVRRASAVSLIYPIRKDRYQDINPFLISDALMNDDHYLVLKGYGWMLKVLSQKNPKSVFDYLMENKEVMPRIAFRYALEKLEIKQKEILMKA